MRGFQPTPPQLATNARPQQATYELALFVVPVKRVRAPLIDPVEITFRCGTSSTTRAASDRDRGAVASTCRLLEHGPVEVTAAGLGEEPRANQADRRDEDVVAGHQPEVPAVLVHEPGAMSGVSPEATMPDIC